MTWRNLARCLAATWGAGWKRSRRRLDGRHPSRLFCRFSVREYKGILFFSPQAGAFLCGAGDNAVALCRVASRSEEHTSELQSLMRISYAVFCLKKKKNNKNNHTDS